MRIGEVLNTAIRLTIRNYRGLLPIVALVVLPIAVLDAIRYAATLSNATVSGHTLLFVSGADVNSYEAGEVGFVVIEAIGGLVVAAACFRFLSSAYLGGHPHTGDSIGAALRRLPAIVVASVVIFAMVAIGTVFLILPGIWLLVALSVAIPALMLEGVGPFKAISRSLELVQGRWWATFGALLAMILFLVVIDFALGIALDGILLSGGQHSTTVLAIVSIVSYLIAQMIVLPFEAAVLTMIYFDLRVRKEGLDVERHAREAGLMGGSPEPAITAGVTTPAALPGSDPAAPTAPAVAPRAVPAPPGEPGSPDSPPPPTVPGLPSE